MDYLVSTTHAEHIAKNLKDFKVVFLGKNKDEKHYFPDGEVYVRIPEVKMLASQHVTVLHCGMPEPNAGLLELFTVLDLVSEQKPKSIDIFFLYFPFQKQDKVFQTGEINMAESICCKLVNYYKVRKIYVIDAHFHKTDWTSRYPLIHISAEQMLKASLPPDALIVAPDAGSQRRSSIAGLEKKRVDSFNVEVSGDLNVKGKTVVVWDDMIATGGTMVKAYEFFKAAGAKKVIAAATHAVILSGVERVKAAFDGLVVTNTIDNPHASVDVSEIVAVCCKVRGT